MESGHSSVSRTRGERRCAINVDVDGELVEFRGDRCVVEDVGKEIVGKELREMYLRYY